MNDRACSKRVLFCMSVQILNTFMWVSGSWVLHMLSDVDCQLSATQLSVFVFTSVVVLLGAWCWILMVRTGTMY